jgi:branched-chain amino acid transport system substrate-binding protein
MAAAAELAIKEVSESGEFLNNSTVGSVRGDSTCVDAGAAVAAAERLITSNKVQGIVGATCSGASTAVLQNVAIPNGIVMVSPSATSPALSVVEDEGLFFRVAPSDARQGEVLAEFLRGAKHIETIAISYTNNDYGKGLADSIQSNFEKFGGKVTISASHEDGKGDYSAEVGALAAADGEVLVVAGYLDQGGKGIVQGALDAGAFDTFMLPDGMVGESLIEAIGPDLNGSFGTIPGSLGPIAETFGKMAEENGFKVGPYTAEAYDSAALILLAMQAAGSSDSQGYKDKIFDVANRPGEPIAPGELSKALKILAEGGDIDYVGASNVELFGPGEGVGNFRLIEIKNGEIVTIGIQK